VARVAFRQSLSFKDMAEVTIAVSAADFGAPSIWIGEAFYCIGKILVKSRPAATRIKFRLGIVERSMTAATEIGAGREERIVLSGKRSFCPAGFDDGSFCWAQGMVGHMPDDGRGTMGTLWRIPHSTSRAFVSSTTISTCVRSILSISNGKGLKCCRRKMAKRDSRESGIILDLQMPVKSGLDVLRELDTDPKLKTIPVVILSNVDDEEMYKKVGKYNTRFYLVKALTSPEKVIKILREALH
jgi:CheY-like chemotaxis protein